MYTGPLMWITLNFWINLLLKKTVKQLPVSFHLTNRIESPPLHTIHFFCYTFKSLFSPLSHGSSKMLKWKIVKKYYFIFLLVLIVYRRSFNRIKVVEVIGWDSIRLLILQCGILVGAFHNIFIQCYGTKVCELFWCWTILLLKVERNFNSDEFHSNLWTKLQRIWFSQKKTWFIFNKNK